MRADGEKWGQTTVYHFHKTENVVCPHFIQARLTLSRVSHDSAARKLRMPVRRYFDADKAVLTATLIGG